MSLLFPQSFPTADAEYELFFPKYATNHFKRNDGMQPEPPEGLWEDLGGDGGSPGGGAVRPRHINYKDIPNWYIYWQEGRVCSIPDEPTCLYGGDAGVYGTANTRTGTMVLFDPAAEANEPWFIPGRLSNGVFYGGIVVGGDGKGVKCVAEVVTHEWKHIAYGVRPDPNQPWPAGHDDADGITTAEEQGLPLRNDDGNVIIAGAGGGLITDHINPNTYGLPAPYLQSGDQEVRCLQAEENPLPYHVGLDWANPGCNSIVPYGP